MSNLRIHKSHRHHIIQASYITQNEKEEGRNKDKKAVGDQYFNRYENLQIRCGFVEACGGSGIEQGTAFVVKTLRL